MGSFADDISSATINDMGHFHLDDTTPLVMGKSSSTKQYHAIPTSKYHNTTMPSSMAEVWCIEDAEEEELRQIEAAIAEIEDGLDATWRLDQHWEKKWVSEVYRNADDFRVVVPMRQAFLGDKKKSDVNFTRNSEHANQLKKRYHALLKTAEILRERNDRAAKQRNSGKKVEKGTKVRNLCLRGLSWCQQRHAVAHRERNAINSEVDGMILDPNNWYEFTVKFSLFGPKSFHMYFTPDDHRQIVKNVVIAQLPAKAGEKKPKNPTDTTWFMNHACEAKTFAAYRREKRIAALTKELEQLDLAVKEIQSLACPL